MSNETPLSITQSNTIPKGVNENDTLIWDTTTKSWVARLAVVVDQVHIKGLHATKDWNASFKSKLQASSTTLVKIGLFGDSVSAGSYCSDLTMTPSGTSFPALLMNYLQSIYGDGGSGFIHASQTNNVNIASYNVQYNDSKVPLKYTNPASTTLWAINNTWPTIGGNYTYNNVIGDKITCDYLRGENISVFYICSSGFGSVSVKLYEDGELLSTNTINTNNSVANTAGSTTYTKEFKLTGLNKTKIHTVVIELLDVLTFTFAGISAYNNTGVVINNFSYPGLALTTINIRNTASPTIGNSFDYSGGPSFTTLQSDLQILSLLLNDFGVSNDTYYINLVNAVLEYKSSNVNQDMLILNHIYGNGAGILPNTNYHRSSTMRVADAFECAVLDMNISLGFNRSVLAANGYFAGIPSAYPDSTHLPGVNSTNDANANAVHPGNYGHSLIYSKLKDSILQ